MSGLLLKVYLFISQGSQPTNKYLGSQLPRLPAENTNIANVGLAEEYARVA